MTVYSRHSSRGKVQILATYHGTDGVVSSTVTSVEDASLAKPIVHALNRISACATVPMSVWDQRSDRVRSYPSGHLAALTDAKARPELLMGSHGLWYEQAMWHLHRALSDLDDCIAVVPDPVRLAVSAELADESRGLHEALNEFSKGIRPAANENRRLWRFGHPFVALDGGIEGLNREDRESLDRLERGASAANVARAIDDLRVLLDAYTQCANGCAMLTPQDLSISDDPDPFGPSRFFLDVTAPFPGDSAGRDEWGIDIGWWEVDDPDAPEESSDHATGRTILSCSRTERPAVAEIVDLLNQSDGQSGQLARWSRTPVGQALSGTAFVVTERYSS